MPLGAQLCDPVGVSVKQSLRDLDRWAMSPQALRPLVGASVAFVAGLFLVIVVLTDLSPLLLVLPSIGFVVTMVVAYRGNRRTS